MTDLVPKASIEEIVRRRDEALQLFRSALIQFRSANEALQQAAPGSYGLSVEIDRRYMMTGHDLEEPVVTGILAGIRKEVDQDVWRYLVEASGMRNFMDTAALKEFEENLKNPPEITEQNIQDTLAGLQLQRGRIFRRGLVNLFRSLSGTWARRHKSNSPFKIGRRVVLTRAVTSWYVSRRSEFSDLDRIFHILDRKPPPDHLGDLGTLIGQAKRDVTMLETPYFRVRWFANGNAHVYFLRDDLVTLANKLIAEELGPALGESA